MKTTIKASSLKPGDSILFDASYMTFAKVAKIEPEETDLIVTTERGDELCVAADSQVIIDA
jgi:hypothetical protein